jgi:hypothetical protein
VVFVDAGGPETLPRAVPVPTGGPDELSAVTAADGWVEVAEAAEGVPAEATVTVQHWDRCP